MNTLKSIIYNLSPYFFSNLLFYSFNRFIVLLTTHSDPRDGNLHFAPNNMGAAPVAEVRFKSSLDPRNILIKLRSFFLLFFMND
jgi:hypothetical protein